MLCAKCHSANLADAVFCAECGAKLELLCPSCAVANAPGSKFCRKCGARLIDDAPPVRSADSTSSKTSVTMTVAAEPDSIPDGERKTVTALFADIKGSTELMEDLDPEEARAIIDPALKLMVEAVRRYDGYVVQSTGDGIFALFGAPLAHEDHPQRALYAALQIQQELRQHGQRAASGRPALEARIGVNTGEVVVRSVETGGRVEYTPIGHTANLASRLQTMAPAGSIATSEYTRNLCEGYFELRALGPMAARGISEAISVYEVTGLGSLRTHFQLSARRGLTKFVGRERELEQMQHALQQAMDGHGQIITVMAEAGTGKSRLFYEFKATIPPTCKVLEAYSVSHGKASAWLPVLELLCGYFDIEDADESASRREKIRAVLGRLDPALQDSLPYLFGLLGLVEGPDPLAQMDPQIKRRRTLDAFKRIILRESINQPVVVIFEDLHWIDAQTQALLDVMADSIANSRVLLLVNYRPEYRHDWGNKSYYAQLRLDALGRESAGTMLATLLGDGVELDPVKRMVIERTEGNPFFIEEMVHALFDEGALVHNGAVKVTRSLSQLTLPTTVQGILASRIDRLPAEQKELVQTLAVMGRESPLGLIRKVASTGNAPLDQMLSALQAGEFIYEQPSLAGVEYTFKHALTQEVAYNSLLLQRRKPLHERAAGAIESLYADRLDDHLNDLAHHYQHSDNVSRAVEYLGRAGQQAMQRSAYTDAVSHLAAAIDLLPKLPDSPEHIQRELLLQLAIGPALMAAKGYTAQEVERAFTRARELCERLGDPPQLFHVLFGLWAVHIYRGELQTARQLGERLLQRAQSAQGPALLLWAHHALGSVYLFMGELLLAKEHLELALSLDDPERPSRALLLSGDARVVVLENLGLLLWGLGYPDQALKRCYEALALARAGSVASDANAQSFVVGLLMARREASATQEGADRLMALSAEHGLTLLLAAGTISRGWAIAAQGRHAEGIAQIQEGLAALRATGTKIRLAWDFVTLAAACLEADRLDDGLSALTEALAAADEHENRIAEAEIRRLRGELLLKQDDSNTAEAQLWFERAIEAARKQSAKSLELRATTSLARLLDTQGHRDEARTMLADIYGWFTEGFDTADLKDAKALLEELNSES